MMRIVLIAAGAVALCGCNPIAALKPYRMEIQQGNFIDEKLVAQLRVGMTREQARAALGTPLVTDVFHADRWDYLFWRQRANETAVERHRLTLYFQNDRLARFESDEKPEPPPTPQTAPTSAPSGGVK